LRSSLNYSARRIALYTASQCAETSSKARAVVRLQARDHRFDFCYARLKGIDLARNAA
jgi:hypothetical protein